MYMINLKSLVEMGKYLERHIYFFVELYVSRTWGRYATDISQVQLWDPRHCGGTDIRHVGGVISALCL